MSPRRLALAGLTAALLVTVAASDAGAQGLRPEPAGSAVSAGLWFSRLANYLSLALTVGFLAAAAWFTAPSATTTLGAVGQRAVRAAALSGSIWTVSTVALFLFGLANAAAAPVSEVLDLGALGRFAETRFGAAVAAQAAVAGCVAALAGAARTTTGARIALGFCGLAALGHAWGGHAGSSHVPFVAVPNDWVHILAAAGWAGGLAALTLLLLVGAPAEADVVGPARRFSRFAPGALAAVLATGVVNTAVHIPDPALLVDTAWGRLALLKLALVGAIGVLGWWNRRRSLPGVRRQPDRGRAAFRRVALAELGLMVLAFGTATTMASGAADVEAAARVASVTVPFADGSVNLTLDPGVTGANELHLYVFGADGGLRPVEAASVALRRDGQAVDVRLVDAGPGHYTGPHVELPEAGAWAVEIEGEVDGGPASASTTVTVR